MTHQSKLHRKYGATRGGTSTDDQSDVDLSRVRAPSGLTRQPSRYDKVAGSVGGLLGANPNDAKRWEESGMYRKKQGQGYHRLAAYDDDEPTAAETRLDRPASRQQQRGRNEQRQRPTGGRLPAWRRASVKRRIDALPTFRPWFTVFITLVQVGITIYTLVEGGLAPIRFSPKTEEKLIDDPMNRPGLSGNAIREIPFNFFIGPAAKYLVGIGAKYTLCMRHDTTLLTRMAREADRENQFLCCAVGNKCGMMDPAVCGEMGVECDIRGGPKQCNASFPGCEAGVALHPCCVGLDASCIITSEDNCSFYDGVYHPNKVLCRDVDCLGSVCDTPLEAGTITAASANQWFRFFTAIFLQSGIISAVLFLGAQLYLGIKIERQIGLLRILLIYTASGVGGYLLSGIFDPNTSQVGCSGAVFGLFGIRFVELIQRWQAIQKPCQQLTSLVITLIAALALGTTPYLDNFANVGGFIFGIISSFVFVPYLTFGKFDAARKCCFVLTGFLILAGLFFVGFVVFYNTQNTEFCSWCSYINCVPYTATFCDEGFSAFSIPGT